MKNKLLLTLVICISAFLLNAQTHSASSRLSPINDSLASTTATNYDADKMYYPTNLNPIEYSETHFYDRFGDPIPLSLIQRTNNQSNQQGHGLSNTKASEVTAGHFVLHYVENGVGFDGPKGSEYQAVLEQVCRDISALIATPPNDPCPPYQPAKVHLLINGGDPLPNGALGGATSAYNTSIGENMVLDGEVWKVLVTGKSSSTDIHHGFVKINFNYNFYTSTTALPYGVPGGIGMTNGRFEEYDLYSVILHELLHMLGFNSFIDYDGQSEYKSKINKSFFSRFDLLTTVNGLPAVFSSTPSTSFYNLSSNLNSETTILGCSSTKSNPSSCGYLSAHQGLFSPAPFIKGSSLSHFDLNCTDGDGNTHNYVMTYSTDPRVINRKPDVDEVNLLNELGYHTTGIYGSDPTFTSSYNIYSGGSKGQKMGGVNDDFDCTTKNPNYIIKSCPNNPPMRISLNNNGTLPTAIEGLRVIGESIQNPPTLIGTSEIEIKIIPETEGYNFIQYIPIYGCMKGNITTILIYTYPCATPFCFLEGNPECKINCDSEMEESIYPAGGANCRTVKKDLTNEVQKWKSLNRLTTPDYYQFANGKRGIGLAANQYWTEGVYHQFNLKVGKDYKFKIRSRMQPNMVSACPSGTIPFPEFVRIRAGKGDYVPLNDSQRKSYPHTENYIESNYNTTVIRDILPESLGGNSTFQDYEFCYSPTEDYDFILIYLKPSGNGEYVTFDLFEIVEIPEISQQVLIPCNQTSVEVNAPNPCGQLNNMDIQWKDNQGSIVSTDNSFLINTPGDYTINTILSNGNNCSSQQFSVISLAGFEVNGNVTQIDCNAGIVGSIQLSVSGGNPSANYTYQWNNGMTTKDISNLGPGTYTVTVSASNHCFVSKSFQINSAAANEVQLTTSNLIICGETPTTVWATPSLSFAWLHNNQPYNSPSTSTSISCSESGVYQISFSAINGQCYYSQPISLEKIENPVVTASTQTRLCPEEAGLMVLENPQNTNLQWYKNVTAINGANNPSYSTTQAGDYRVIISYLDCSLSSNSITLTKISPPIIETLNTTVICGNEHPNLRVTNYTSGIQWFNAGTPISSANNINFEPINPGTFYVQYEEGTCELLSNEIVVTVAPNPAISSSGQNWICENYHPILHVDNYSTGIQWYRDGTQISGENEVDFEPTNQGTYYAEYSLGDCRLISNSIAVTRPAAPVISAAGSTIFCQNESVELRLQGTSNATFQWFKNASSIPNETSANFFATSSGSYSLLTSQAGCDLRSNVIQVTVKPLPIAYAGPHICMTSDYATVGGTVTKPTGTGGNGFYSYEWTHYGEGDAGFQTSTNLPNVVVSPTRQATYAVAVTSDGCTSYSKVTVTPKIIPELVASRQQICSGDYVDIAVTNPLAYPQFSTISWTPNHQQDWEIEEEPTTTTNYTATVYTPGGCMFSNSITINVTPPIIVNAGPDQTYCTTVRLGGNPTASGGSGSFTYSWSPNTGATPLASIFTNKLPNPTVTPNTNVKTYQVKVTSGGCVAYDKITVTKAQIYGNSIWLGSIPCDPANPLMIYGTTPTGGIGTYTYTWEKRVAVNGNITWQPMPNGAEKDYRVLTTGRYRRKVRSGTCAVTYSNIIPVTTLTSEAIWPVAPWWGGLSTACDVINDSKGNTYVVGTYNDILSFPDHYVSAIKDGYYLAKFDPCGNVEWIGGAYSNGEIPFWVNQSEHTLEIDNQDNVYVAFETLPSNDFQTFYVRDATYISQQYSIPANENRTFILKFSPGGVASILPLAGHVSGLAVNPGNQNIYLVRKDINYSDDTNLEKYGSNNSLVWSTKLPGDMCGNPINQAINLAADNANAIFFAYCAQMAQTFNASTTVGNDFTNNVIYGKFNDLGSQCSLAWVKASTAGIRNDNANLICSNDGLSLYMAAVISGPAFGISGSTNEWAGAVSLNPSNGNQIWSKEVSGLSGNASKGSLWSTAIHPVTKNLYLSGTYLGTPDNRANIFMAGFDINGTQLLVKKYSPVTAAGAISVDPVNNHLFLTGSFKQSLTFDSKTVECNDPNNPGAMFVTRFDMNGVADLTQNGGTDAINMIEPLLINPENEEVLMGSQLATINNKQTLHLFPNPTSNNITILGLESLEIPTPQIKLFNAIGVEIMVTAIKRTKNETTLNLSNVADGVYYVKILDEKENTVYTSKISVTR